MSHLRASATAQPADPPWRVSLRGDVRHEIAAAGKRGAFRPSIEALIAELERDPKQFPKKAGKLAGARAAPLRYRGHVSWRAVFTLDEMTRTVYVLAVGPHDAAYATAARRI